MLRSLKLLRSVVLVACGLFLSVNLSGQGNGIRVIDQYYYFPDGRLYTGIYEIYAADQVTLLGEVQVVEGRLHGKAVYYFEDGDVRETGFFAEGKKDGNWKKFREDGQLEMEACYHQGKKDGIWYVYDVDGSTIYEFAYDANQPTGHWKRWDGNGKLIAERRHE